MKPAAQTMMQKTPPDRGADAARQGLSSMARRMIGSSILKVADEIRALKGAGVPVADLTVGDFDPREFPIPSTMQRHLREAVDAGETNYPPAPGLRELRVAVRDWLRRTQDLDYPEESVVVIGGARPGLYSAYRLLTDPGERVLYPVPSWNNTNYRDVCGVEAVELKCGPENAFQPTAERIAASIAGVRLVVLNSPQNPSGGVLTPEEMGRIGRLVVEENRRRAAAGEKPLFLLLDQIYRALVFEGSRHVSPVQVVPECKPFVVHVDGISKFCAATGLRVGWMVAPPLIAAKAVALLTHVGAWAPRPVQAATARFLADQEGALLWEQDMTARVEERLRLLYRGLMSLKEEGFPVEAIAPQGAIYISVRFPLQGRKIPEGRLLASNEDVRAYLLSAAGFGLVPFSAFGVHPDDEDGWFRASVGAVSQAGIQAAIPRVREALKALG